MKEQATEKKTDSVRAVEPIAGANLVGFKWANSKIRKGQKRRRCRVRSFTDG